MLDLFRKYLQILKVGKKEPSLDYLTELLKSHLYHIPFENISKLYYLKTQNLKFIPDFSLYIHGIETNHFGGTCYSNNYYFNKLLNHLGFDVRLCGADMNNPDVHLVNIVNINNCEYLIDVGYAAPFVNPIPLKLEVDYSIKIGNEEYIIRKKIDSNGRFKLEHFIDGTLNHGYFVKPYNRTFSEFTEIIKDSFSPSSTFMNRITIARFSESNSLVIRNFSLIKLTKNSSNVIKMQNMDEITSQIHKNFDIPILITSQVLKGLTNL